MELFQKQIMLEKDKCSRKNSLNILIKTIFILVCCNCVFANSINEKEHLINYINNLKNFSANFIQSDGTNVEEGVIYIGTDRIKVDYINPTKITITLDNDKAMFINHDLKEVQYFDPRDSSAGIFLDIFQNTLFFYESLVKIENQTVLLKKQSKDDNENYILEVLFEKNPYILRKIMLDYDDFNIFLSLSNHNYNNILEKKFFSMANPFLKN